MGNRSKIISLSYYFLNPLDFVAIFQVKETAVNRFSFTADGAVVSG